LGYFRKNFARLAKKGKVIGIEPVPAFKDLLTKKLGSFSNVEIKHTALGNSNGEITMVLPKSNGMIRTGLPHIMDDSEKDSDVEKTKVALTHAGELFNSFERGFLTL
jgi:FkbM family methyltransferase